MKNADVCVCECTGMCVTASKAIQIEQKKK